MTGSRHSLLAAIVAIPITVSTLAGCGTRVESSDTTAAVENRPPARSHPGSRPGSLLLPSHESKSKSLPDADDVDPSFHVGLEQLRKRVADDSTDASSVLKLARLLQDAHQTEEAITEYRRYLRLTPGSREAWLDLAKTYGSLGNWTEALTASDSLLAHFPDDPSGLYNKGAVLANLGRAAEARAAWLKVEQQDDDPQMKKMAELGLSRLGK